MNKLSDTQQLILTHLQDGKTPNEIALALGVSFGTVRSQIARIMEKHNVTKRTDLPGVPQSLTYRQQKILDLFNAGESYVRMEIEMNTRDVSAEICTLRKRGLVAYRINRDIPTS